MRYSSKVKGRCAVSRRGFTVLESLIAMAAVVVLAGVFVAVFRSKRLPPRYRDTCHGQMRLVGVTIQQYAADSDGYFPPVNGNAKSFGWADAIWRSPNGAKLLQCPADTTWPAAGDGPKSKNYSDYLYNATLSNKHEGALQAIASSVMLAESIPGDARQSSSGLPSLNGFNYSLVDRAGAPIGAAIRHLDGSNYCFADGHVKWMKGSDNNNTPGVNLKYGSTSPTFSIT